jgi:hypothetical protein
MPDMDEFGTYISDSAGAVAKRSSDLYEQSGAWVYGAFQGKAISQGILF